MSVQCIDAAEKIDLSASERTVTGTGYTQLLPADAPRYLLLRHAGAQGTSCIKSVCLPLSSLLFSLSPRLSLSLSSLSPSLPVSLSLCVCVHSLPSLLLELNRSELTPMSRVVLVLSCPDNSPARMRMIYASTLNAFADAVTELGVKVAKRVRVSVLVDS